MKDWWNYRIRLVEPKRNFAFNSPEWHARHIRDLVKELNDAVTEACRVGLRVRLRNRGEDGTVVERTWLSY